MDRGCFMTSKTKTLSNKENSQKSTGPNNTSKTRHNAIKHGVTSQMVVINGMESQEEFDELRIQIVSELQPATKIEKLVVDKIVIDFWKLKRLQNYETYRIQYNLDKTKESVKRNDSLSSSLLASITQGGESLESMEKKYDKILDQLDEAEVDGVVCEGFLEKYKEEGEDKAHEEYVKALKFMKIVTEMDLKKKRAEINAKTKKEKPLRMIPGPELLDKISRYETTLQRSIKHNLDLLKEVRVFGFVSQNSSSGGNHE